MRVYNTFPENPTTTIGDNEKAGPVTEATATREAGLEPDEPILTAERCQWFVVGGGYCKQRATHTHYNHLRGDEMTRLCKYQVGVARRDGWTSIYRDQR